MKVNMLPDVYFTAIANQIVVNDSFLTVKEAARNSTYLLNIFEYSLKSSEYKKNPTTSHSILKQIFKIYFKTEHFTGIDQKIISLVKKETPTIKNLMRENSFIEKHKNQNAISLGLITGDFSNYMEEKGENPVHDTFSCLSTKNLFKILNRLKEKQNLGYNLTIENIIKSRILTDIIPVYESIAKASSFENQFLNLLKEALLSNRDIQIFQKIYYDTHMVPELHQICIDYLLNQFQNKHIDLNYFQLIMKNISSEVAFKQPLLSQLNYEDLKTVISNLSDTCLLLDLSNCQLLPSIQENTKVESLKRKASNLEMQPPKRLKLNEGGVSSCATIADKSEEDSILELLPKHLRTLILTNDLKDEDLQRLVKRCPDLHSLSLQDIRSASEVGYKELEKLNLKTLTLKNCDNLSERLIEGIVNTCKSMQKINLDPSIDLTERLETHIRLKLAFRQLKKALEFSNETSQEMIKSQLINPNNDGNTLIHLFASQKPMDFFNLLNRYNHSIFNQVLNIKNKKGETPLYFSLKNGRIEFFNYLLKEHKNLLIKMLDQKDHENKTILHLAAFNENQTLANLLWTLDPQLWETMLSEVDATNRTPIHYCMLNRSLDFFAFCWEKNSFLISELFLKKNDQNISPLNVIISDPRLDVFEIIFKSDSYLTEKVLIETIQESITVFDIFLREERFDILKALFTHSPQVFNKLFNQVKEDQSTSLDLVDREKRIGILYWIANLDRELFTKLSNKYMK